MDYEGILAPAKKLKSSSSSSSSLDSSVEDIVFQVDPQVISKSSASIAASPEPHEDAKLLLKDDKIDESQLPLHSMSPTQSPNIQVMERPGGYDPSRIPESVFASKSPAAANEWSVTSNESLFSIHMGNNSFSKDHALLFGVDLYKSGELTKSGELIMLKPPPPLAVGSENEQKSVDVGKNFGATGVAADETMKHVPRETVDDQGEEKLPHLEVSWNSSSTSTHHHSDMSGASGQSFAFPIKKKKSAWPSCHCFNCSWTFCYCTWPSCYCSNCSWVFCYSWNSRRKIFCCSSSNILTDEGTGKGDLVKRKPEQLLTQPPASNATPKAGFKKWFSCLRCCTCC
uniref:Uncharacterized protein n=1 Tax=Davidia involucrata TaxID=16924 RepID=A0A5B7BAK9_DAVIN